MKTMKFLASFVVSVLICGASALADSKDKGGERSAGRWLFPGEYESHQAMWMLWPTYENKAGFPSTEPMSNMIHAMNGHVHVNLAVQDADEEAAVRSLLTANGVPSRSRPLLPDRAPRHLGAGHRTPVHAEFVGRATSTTGTSTIGATRNPAVNTAGSRSHSIARSPRPSTSRCSTPRRGRLPGYG